MTRFHLPMFIGVHSICRCLSMFQTIVNPNVRIGKIGPTERVDEKCPDLRKIPPAPKNLYSLDSTNACFLLYFYKLWRFGDPIRI